MDFADPMNRSEWRGRLRGRLVKQAQPSVEETGFKMDMMMMMMYLTWSETQKTDFLARGSNTSC